MSRVFENQELTYTEETVVIIGAGMAGSRLAEELTLQSRKKVVLIGEEPDMGYNRIMLSSLLANEIQKQDMMLVDLEAMRQKGACLIAHDPVKHVFPNERTVVLQSGRRIRYDKLVFATGSRFNRLPVPGCHAVNVIGFRDWLDVNRMAELAENSAAVVIGGGLLGLEAAVGLVKRGHRVTLLHNSEYLLNRQLDKESAQLLQTKLEGMGIHFRLGNPPASITLDEAGLAQEVVLKSGDRVCADLVVMAAGIVPEVTLAEQAGLRIGRAIQVDEHMQTSLDRIYALGECCEFEGNTFGLVAPIWDQINTLIQTLAGKTQPFQLEPVPTKLKVSGVNLFSVGEIHPTDAQNCIIYRDHSEGHYRKLVVNEGRLVGAILYGDVADGGWYFQLIQNQTNVTDLLDFIVFGEAYCADLVA